MNVNLSVILNIIELWLS